MITIIAAVANNGVIGKDNKLPWKLAADMAFFKETTMGHCVITGRKNYESIPEKFRPLKGRTNIVVTRQDGYMAEGATVVSSIEEAIKFAKSTGDSEIFIIGGAQIYEQCLNLADKMYITRIDEDFDGDTFFPEITKDWAVTVETVPEDKSEHKYKILIYEKKNG